MFKSCHFHSISAQHYDSEVDQLSPITHQRLSSMMTRGSPSRDSISQVSRSSYSPSRDSISHSVNLSRQVRGNSVSSRGSEPSPAREVDETVYDIMEYAEKYFNDHDRDVSGTIKILKKKRESSSSVKFLFQLKQNFENYRSL